MRAYAGAAPGPPSGGGAVGQEPLRYKESHEPGAPFNKDAAFRNREILLS